MPLINNDLSCTLETCTLNLAPIHYTPSLAGNIFYIWVFIILSWVQIVQLWAYRSWSFSLAMLAALSFEAMGYYARVQIYHHPFYANNFMRYLTFISIAPIFLTAAIHVTLPRIIVHYGVRHKWFSPKLIMVLFLCCDVVALALQSSGAMVTSSARTMTGMNAGIGVLTIGLYFQVSYMIAFMAVAGHYVWMVLRLRKGVDVTAHDLAQFQRATQGDRKGVTRFNLFLLGIILAFLCILIRNIYRIVELSYGLDGLIAKQQIPFMILEGGMISACATLLTLAHAGRVFGPKWKNAGWKKTDAERAEEIRVRLGTYIASNNIQEEVHGSTWENVELRPVQPQQQPVRPQLQLLLPQWPQATLSHPRMPHPSTFSNA